MDQEENDQEITVDNPPMTNGIVFGKYTFHHQLYNYGLPAKEVRVAASRYFKTRAMESYLISNPWFALSVTPPRIYLNEEGYCTSYTAVNCYSAIELYMITKMALENKVKRLKLQDETLAMWVHAHNAWLGQCYGTVRENPFTGAHEIKNSFVTNGAFVFRQLLKHMPQSEDAVDMTPELESSRADFLVMLVDSMVNTFANFIAATEFYLSKLVEIINMHTNKGLLTFSGNWQDKYTFAKALIGSPQFYAHVKAYPHRFTVNGSVTFIDFWVTNVNKGTHHAQRCKKMMSIRDRVAKQIDKGEVLHYNQVDCRQFHEFLQTVLGPTDEQKVTDQKRQDLEEKQKMVMKEVLKELHSQTPSPPPPPLPLTRQTAHRSLSVGDGPLSPMEQITVMESPPLGSPHSSPAETETVLDDSDANLHTD